MRQFPKISAKMTKMFDDTVAVVENRPLTGGHFLLSLHSPRQARATRPGQFAMVRLLGRSDVLLRRPMSIYDVVPVASSYVRRSGDRRRRPERSEGSPLQKDSPEMIQLLYKIVGRGTRLMAELKAGDEVGLLAPLGHGFFAEEYLDHAQQAHEILLVAGGIGIAALLLPAKEIAAAGISQRLFFGGRTKDDLVGTNEFKPLVKQIVLATENGSRGHRGYVTQPLEAFLTKNQSKRYLIMVCGPWGMLEASVRLANQYGHPCLLSMENRMGCGLGVCLGCCIRVEGTGHGAYQRVCTEGPVFWAEKVVWRG
jgi:dihydroorotate dehydrogenase electron transfer subunit